MSGSSNLNSFRDRRLVAVQLASCGVCRQDLLFYIRHYDLAYTGICTLDIRLDSLILEKEKS